MPKRPFLALTLLGLALLSGCAGGTSSTTAPTPTGPRPPVPLGVYLSTNFPQATAPGYDTLYAFNASDGSQRWQFPRSGGAAIVDEQAWVANGNVFLVTEDSAGAQVTSLKGSDGSVRWQKSLQHNGVDTWFMDQNSLYVSLQGTVDALSASDGSSRWQQQFSTEPSRIGAASDGVAFSQSSGKALVFFHTSDGSVLWRFPPQGTLDLRVERVINNVVYVSGMDDGKHPELDTFYALNAADGSVRWKYAVGGHFEVLVG
ncbi:MAG TPA: PQQ-binding-like beta-propeller repeat protein [Ktedonobacterales bacterium]|nr:PQQ-binding-like beta-propeller repeat protein [Ktedonobacterales bacterium]